MDFSSLSFEELGSKCTNLIINQLKSDSEMELSKQEVIRLQLLLEEQKKNSTVEFSLAKNYWEDSLKRLHTEQIN